MRPLEDSLLFGSLVVLHYAIDLEVPGERPNRMLALDGADGHVVWRRDDVPQRWDDLGCRFMWPHANTIVVTRCPNANQVQLIEPTTGKVTQTITLTVP